MDEQGQQTGGMPSGNMNGTQTKWLKGLTIAGYACSGLAVLSLVLIVAAVIGDWHITGSLFVVVLFLSLLTSVAGIVASLVGKRWLAAGGGCGCLVLTLILAFFAAILVGVGQHHPPELQDIVDTCEFVEDEW